MLYRLRAAAMAAVIALGTVAGPVVAQTYPTKPIHVIVPWPPGAADVFVRILQPFMEKELGQPLVIENRAGANGLLGTGQVAKAAPDGYTLLFNVTSSVVMGPLVSGDTSFDVKKDLVPFADVVYGPVYFIVRSDLPVNSFQDFLTYARNNPGKINIGSPGTGSTMHILIEEINWLAKVKTTHVPYRGFVPMMQALQGGELQGVFIYQGMALNDLKSGKLKALAIENPTSSPNALPVPDLAKELPGFVTAPSYALFMAPAGTPKPILDRLNAAAVNAMRVPEAAQKLQVGDQITLPRSPAEAAAEFARNLEVSAKLVEQAKAAGVKLTE